MSAESFIQALPKVELSLQLEGAIARETLLMLAEQNEMESQIKRFNKWVEKYRDPDFKKLDELTAMLRSWIQYGDDLTRAVYDVGVTLSKDNVRYAEIGINPLSFVTGDLTFDEFMEALNDGRDRVERGWGVKMRWVIFIPRDDPRHADEIARWATSNTARDGGVVAVALSGSSSPRGVTLDQFERAFQTAARKGLSRTAYLQPNDDIDEAVDLLGLDMIVDAWGLAESPETAASLKERGVTVNIGLGRAIKYGWVKKPEDYPLAALQAHDVSFIISSDMPTLYETTLSDEYLMFHKAGLLSLEDIETVVRGTLARAHFPDDEGAVMALAFETDYEILRAEHLEGTEGAVLDED